MLVLTILFSRTSGRSVELLANLLVAIAVRDGDLFVGLATRWWMLESASGVSVLAVGTIAAFFIDATRS